MDEASKHGGGGAGGQADTPGQVSKLDYYERKGVANIFVCFASGKKPRTRVGITAACFGAFPAPEARRAFQNHVSYLREILETNVV